MSKKMMIAVLMILTGCQTGLKNMAAGETGCMPDDVKIVVEPDAWSMVRQKFYVAECQGVQYGCSYVLTENSTRDLHCKEMKSNK